MNIPKLVWNFVISPPKIKIFLHLKKLFFLMILIFSSCSKPSSDYATMFLENVMIRECGLYVLMGSKPMSTFPIDNGYPETKEEFLSYFETYLRNTRKGYDTLENEYLSTVYLHIKRLWNEWKKGGNNKVGPKYLFVARKNPFGEKRLGGLFINIPNTLFTLDKYNETFIQVFGKTFDSAIILEEISNDDSEFWTKVMADHRTQGLLFGYGYRNSYMFSWHEKNGLLPNCKNTKNLLKEKIKLKDLPLPSISTYSIGEEVLEAYSREKKDITRQFKGKDKVSFIMHWLQCEQ